MLNKENVPETETRVWKGNFAVVFFNLRNKKLYFGESYCAVMCCTRSISAISCWNLLHTPTQSLVSRKIAYIIIFIHYTSGRLYFLLQLKSVDVLSYVQSLPLDGEVKESVWRGKVCFLCMRTKFGLFSRGQKCDMCKQTVCARCFTKVSRRPRWLLYRLRLMLY